MNRKSLKLAFLIIAILIIILIPFLFLTSAQPKQLQPQTKVITQTQVTEKYTTETIIKQPIIQKKIIKYYYNYYPKYYKPKYPYKYEDKLPRCYKDSDCNIDCPQVIGQDTPRCSSQGKCYCGSSYTKQHKSFKAKELYTPPTRNYHKPENRPLHYYPIDL